MTGRTNETAALVVGDGAVAPWGIRPAERLARAFRRAGVAAVTRHPEPPSAATRVVVARGDHVYDEALVRGLARQPDVLLLGADGPLAANVAASDARAVAEALAAKGPLPANLGLVARDAEALASVYRQALRKRSAPLLVALEGADRRAVERRMFDDSYKGVTDLVTKYVWPTPAFWATRACARLGVSPNLVTWASLGFVLLALVLFREGQFLAGVAAAWAMCFLDTVDGKLARVTLTSSRFGNALDHGIDLIHPPFWYLAWAAALEDGGLATPMHDAVVAVVVAGYVVGRLQEGLFLWLFGFEMHVWRRLDSWFRLITARRNPNLILLSLGALAGRPDLGLLAVAAWTVASIAFHFARIGQAFVVRSRGGPIGSWLADARRA